MQRNFLPETLPRSLCRQQETESPHRALLPLITSVDQSQPRHSVGPQTASGQSCRKRGCKNLLGHPSESHALRKTCLPSSRPWLIKLNFLLGNGWRNLTQFCVTTCPKSQIKRCHLFNLKCFAYTQKSYKVTHSLHK